MSTTTTPTEADAIAALSAARMEPTRIDDGAPFVSLPPGYQVHDVEKMLPAPVRMRGNVALRDAASFIDYCKRVMFNAQELRVFGCYEPPSFRAVFNAGREDCPLWGDHTATYACPLSVEWKTWIGTHKKPMNQEAFAQFIEDNAPDIHALEPSDPGPADMLLVSRTLEAKKKVNFASGIRLSNGEQELTYEETIQGTAGKGKLKVPEAFHIAIPVFEGAASKHRIKARLRYRIDNGGGLAMWYDLERHHKDLEAAVRAVWAEVEAGLGVKVLNGG